MKKLFSLVLALALLSTAAYATGYEAIYSSDNPIPAIVRAVRPAVVEVISIQQDWSVETGIVDRDVGSGSGVYVDDAGYIITNNHVIDDADKVKVILWDDTELDAEIVGCDEGIDIAVIKIEPQPDITPVPMGDSDQIEVGELAIAIGNPGTQSSATLKGSVTAGIISAVGREEMGAGVFTRPVALIQTDAAINTGNSGGALLNARGELIGIPMLKYIADAAAVYESLGFAIPINTIKPVYEQLVATGKMVRPMLGVTVVDNAGPYEPLKRYSPAGAKVYTVSPGTSAERSGILPNDIITHVNGVRVSVVNDLLREIDKHAVGDVLELTVCRFYDSVTGEALDDYETLTFSVELAIIN
ncbi:MAG: trypsin-like peptidase domain-containing protein [Clostridia bacterium]|nr:trypsin-like peptidase domain-containing protein [Clostridia bacterium]